MSAVEERGVVAIGSDGTRIVVWGIGETEEDAEEDAEEWIEDSTGPKPELFFAEVTVEQMLRIADGEVDAKELGLV